MLSNNTKALFELVRAGLWEKDAHLSQFGSIDFNEILRLSKEQSVVGLVAAGIEHVVDVKLPQTVVLQFVGQTLQIEQRNLAMNAFIAEIVGKMRANGIDTLLAKGQGVAQCYERPLWRTSGDIDFLLSNANYEKAKVLLMALSSDNKAEGRYSKHKSFVINPWYVELHGSLRSGLSARVDLVIDKVHNNTFNDNNVRIWNNSNVKVFLPGVDNDIIFVFTHFLMHLYREFLGLKQICDWCRLLWTYRDCINAILLEQRLSQAGLISEWMAFSALAVEFLGMPVEAIPLYDSSYKCKHKAESLIVFLFANGKRNTLRDTYRLAKIFPINTLKYLPSILFNVNGLKIKERIFG